MATDNYRLNQFQLLRIGLFELMSYEPGPGNVLSSSLVGLYFAPIVNPEYTFATE